MTTMTPAKRTLALVVALVVTCGTARGAGARAKVPLEPPWDAASFERFLDRCRRDHTPYRLSLRQLAEDCVRAERSGKLPEELRYLRGFTWFFGYLIDRDKGDVYLLGLKDSQRPPIDIDCLVTALRATYENKTPSCSLDPHPDPKYQKSVVLGVPWETRWAEIMIEADYDMKKICQGREDPHIPEIVSWFDLWTRQQLLKPGGEGQELNRWWFNRPRKDVARTLLLDKDGDFVLLYRNPVVVMTEQNIDGKFGTGTVAREADQFATAFTRNLPQLGKRYKSIGELLALYRLLDLAVHLKQVGDVYPPVKDYWLTGYRYPYAGPAKEVPTLTRQVSNVVGPDGRSHQFTISGGVRMPLDLDRGTFKRDPSARALKDRLLGDR
jgi:hypothetical protein